MNCFYISISIGGEKYEDILKLKKLCFPFLRVKVSNEDKVKQFSPVYHVLLLTASQQTYKRYTLLSDLNNR